MSEHTPSDTYAEHSAIEEIREENKMGYAPITKLIFSMSLPIMISMLVQALYNIVDSIFVSRLGEDALSAVSLAFPVQNIMIAVGTGTAVGVNAVLSRALGEKNYKMANKAANNALFLAVCSTLVFVIFGLFFTRPYFEALTDIQTIIDYGVEYTEIVTVVSIGLFGAIMCERLLTSTGRTIYTMVTQLTGAITNIILDPILIFGYFGFPKLGMAGAAIATVAGQILATILGLILNIRLNHEIKLSVKEMKPDGHIIGRIYQVGVPSIVMASIGSVMNFFMNKILLGFTSTATAVFGAYFKLQSFVFMPVFGMNNGVVPIVAYNYGARNKDRIIETRRKAIIYAMALMLVGFAVFQLIPQVLLGMFNPSEEMLRIGVPAMRAISYSFLLAAFSIVTISVCQALGKGTYGLYLSLIRQLFVLLPAAWLLSKTGNLNLVWLAFPIAELAALLLSIYFNKRVMKVIEI
ncbi:MAG: MATE family efflux transporter [Lachnospiraceae bacterium]|nr:MATE family efflux transporter [Lachnospiraceae bacterium]